MFCRFTEVFNQKLCHLRKGSFPFQPLLFLFLFLTILCGLGPPVKCWTESGDNRYSQLIPSLIGKALNILPLNMIFAIGFLIFLVAKSFFKHNYLFNFCHTISASNNMIVLLFFSLLLMWWITLIGYIFLQVASVLLSSSIFICSVFMCIVLDYLHK